MKNLFKNKNIGSKPEKKSSGEQPAKKKMSKPLKALIRLLTKIVLIVVIIWALLTYVGGVFICHDNNNYPAIKDGDLVVTYRLDRYYSGDLVVYDVDGKTYFGRVVGVPGDTIDFKDSYYTVNGIMPYETVYYKTEPFESGVKYPYEVQDGEVFVLADYREEGIDSRLLGGVNNLKGKVVLLLRGRGF